MAVTKITKDTLGLNAWKTITLTTLTSTTDGFEVEWDVHDERTILLVQNTGSSAATVTIKAGNGIQGVKDLDAYSVAGGAVAAIAIDSGAYKNVTGDSKGKVLVTGSATGLKMGLVETL